MRTERFWEISPHCSSNIGRRRVCWRGISHRGSLRHRGSKSETVDIAHHALCSTSPHVTRAHHSRGVSSRFGAPLSARPMGVRDASDSGVQDNVTEQKGMAKLLGGPATCSRNLMYTEVRVATTFSKRGRALSTLRPRVSHRDSPLRPTRLDVKN